MSKWIDRIQNLLAKAESTEFPDEADALISKAQVLMRQHAIDEAMLGDRERSGEPVNHVFTVEGSYLKAKIQILAAIARNNTVQLVLGAKHSKTQSVHMVGYQSDIDQVTAMYGAMIMYATREMIAAPQVGHGKSFRNSFLLAFASTLASRLKEANKEAESCTDDSTGVAIVLASRQDSVDAKVSELFPRLRSSSGSTATSSAGYQAGRSAGERASIGKGVSAGSGRALTS